MSTLDDSQLALQRWIEGRKSAGLGQESEKTNCTGCFSGKGGALFVSLRQLSASETVKVILSDTRFKNNSALFGGIGIWCF